MDEGLLNDLLECSVCLERLDTSSRVLPCQHTFCIKCLKEILQSHKELRCPECRVLVEVRVEELPPNVLLMRILEGMRSRPHPHPGMTLSAQQRMPPAQHHPQPAQHHQQPAQHHPQPAQHHPQPAQHHPQPTQYHPQPYTGPHARAVYDYLSKEPGDLSFKKGDIIFLKRRIDTHWYYGESGGKQGAFPMTYAKVVIPLPVSGSPQCKALYDFHMAPPDEEGCLAFEKGAVICVIRRVDENWAEGRLHERIGIFPIAFVEMNAPARALMKLSNSVRCAPLQAPAESLVGGSALQAGHRPDQINNVYRQQQQQMSLSSPTPLPTVTPTTLAPGPLSRSQPAPVPPQPASMPPQPAPVLPQSAPTPLQSGPDSQPDIIQLVYGSHDNAAKLLVQSLKQHQPKLQPEGAGRSGAAAREAFLKTQANMEQFTGLTSSYHAAGALSSDSSSTTPSLGGSSATTTPNTSSSNTSSESTTPSSPASPAYGAPPEQSRAYCNVTLQASRTVTGEDADVPELSNKSNASNSSPVQNISNGSLNLTPPRSNVSSPRTCTNSQQSAVSLELSSNVQNTNSVYQNVSGRQFVPSHVAYSGSGYTLMAACQAPHAGEALVSPRHSRDGLARGSPHPREKRHSLTAQGLPQNIVQNRHSAEILSPPTAAAGEQEVAVQDLLRLGERERQVDGKGGESRRKERDRRRTASADRQLPAAYVALYPYKPQKADELELKKGGVYMVLERCQDGWYKGCSNRTNKCGVFPGNYVAPAASRQHPNSVQHKAVSPSSPGPKANSAPGVAGPSQRRGEGEPPLQAPPDLPPRAASPTATSSPVFPWSSTPKASAAKSSDKAKDKERSKTEKAPSTMSLMKRLAAMKRGKSPPLVAPNTSVDNPVFEDSPAFTPPHPHPVHIRSGSCPSQLLQESVCGTVGPARGIRQAPGPGRHTLGAGPRARPRPSIAALAQIDRSGEVLWASRVQQPSQQHSHPQQHRKSHSLDAGQQLRNKDSTLTRERFRCIVAYPPNSEYELELQVDDLVLVHRKWGDGWYKGTLERTGRTGLFPASFVEAC